MISENFREADPARRIYEVQELEGPSLDFEKIFNAANRKEALAQNTEANDLYESVLSVIDQKQYPPEAGNVGEIIQAIRFAAKEGGWKSYEDIKFESIRVELQKSKIPTVERKTNRDID